MRQALFVTENAVRKFSDSLATLAVGKRIFFQERTQSTNSLSVEAARCGAAHGTVFVTDVQESGRGQRGREWNCAPGAGLLFSVVVRPRRLEVRDSGWIPLLTGLSCADALSEFSPATNITVKWPNDIVVPSVQAPGWKKMGGILCEAAIQADSPASERYVVAGVGLNIDQRPEELPHGTRAPATSLRVEAGQGFDRRQVFKRVLEIFEANLLRAEDEKNFAALRAEIEQRLRAWWKADTELQFQTTSHAQIQRGTFAGLDEFGCIRLRDASGEKAYADLEIIAAV